jgi:hypothetical protein
LIDLRLDVEAEIKFDVHKSHVHKIKEVYAEMANQINTGICGHSARTKYNYLRSKFRQRNAKTLLSGTGTPK